MRIGSWSSCAYAKHLHPLLRVDRLDQEDVDVGELQLTHYRLTKRAEHQLRLSEEGGDYGLDPATGWAAVSPMTRRRNAYRKSSRR